MVAMLSVTALGLLTFGKHLQACELRHALTHLRLLQVQLLLGLRQHLRRHQLRHQLHHSPNAMLVTEFTVQGRPVTGVMGRSVARMVQHAPQHLTHFMDANFLRRLTARNPLQRQHRHRQLRHHLHSQRARLGMQSTASEKPLTGVLGVSVVKTARHVLQHLKISMDVPLPRPPIARREEMAAPYSFRD